MKLTYWKASCLDDSEAYSIRAKTKKEVVARLETYPPTYSFGPPHKIEVEYDDAFDLVTQITGEGGYGSF